MSLSVIFGFVFFSFGCVLSFFMARFFFKLHAAQRLVPVNGLVKKAWVSEKLYFINVGAVRLFRPDVLYGYKYLDGCFESDAYGLLDRRRWSFQKDSTEMVLPEVGGNIVLYVDPLNPKVSYIDPKVDKVHIDYLLTYSLVSFFLILSGCFLFFLGWFDPAS